MKKTIAGFFIAALLFACGSDDKNGAAKTVGSNADADSEKGLDVIVKYDCVGCHKIDEKLNGPGYRDVANKYAGQADAVKYLSEKIIKGGTGVWGDVPMLPHPNVPQEDAEAIAKYILSLKK